jgi:hypothetical protein
LQPQLLSRFGFWQAQTPWHSDTAASVAADFAVAAVPSVEPDLTVEGFAVALTAMAFAVIGFATATSVTGSSSLAILATHSFTIPIRITDTILTITDTIPTPNLFTKAVPDIPTL